MAYDREEMIRLRAHALWQEEGCPSGQDLRHWQQAEQHIAALEQVGLLPPVANASVPEVPAAA